MHRSQKTEETRLWPSRPGNGRSPSSRRRAWPETIPTDYTWARPNRRHVWSGLYLPGITSESVGEIAIAVDCSGSVSARQLGLFNAEIQSILAGQRPLLVH